MSNFTDINEKYGVSYKMLVSASALMGTMVLGGLIIIASCRPMAANSPGFPEKRNNRLIEGLK